MSFSNPIIGGNDTLVREAIQSEGFQTGVTGWRIARNGNAEFGTVDMRGTWTVAGGDGYIKGDSLGGEPVIELQPYIGNSPPWSPGYVRARDVALLHELGQLALICPNPSGALNVPNLIMESEDLGVPGSRSSITLDATDLFLSGAAVADTIEAGNIQVASTTISFAAATSDIRTVFFPLTMPSTPLIVLPVISSGAGVTTGWTCRTDTYTTSSFRLLLAGPSNAWTNVIVRYLVIS